MTFFKKLWDKLVGKKSDRLIFLESLKHTLGKYVAVNENILKVLKKNNVNLMGEDWKKLFSVAYVKSYDDGKSGFEVYSDAKPSFRLEFPLFDKFTARIPGIKESKLSLRLKFTIHPTLWEIPEECIEPIETMTNANILLNL